MSDVQAVLFDKLYFNERDAKKEFSHMGFKLLPKKKIHETSKFYRFRILDPKDFNHLRTKTIKNKDGEYIGIKFIIGFY